MLSVEEESLNVLEFSVSEQEPILAEQAVGVFGIDSDNNITNIIFISSLLIRESNVFEAEAISVGNRSLIWPDRPNSNGEEVTSFIWILTLVLHSVVALVDSISAHLLFVDLSLNQCLLQMHSLSLIILQEIFLGEINSLGHAVHEPVNDFH